jgi:hypothetical protein
VQVVSVPKRPFALPLPLVLIITLLALTVGFALGIWVGGQ